MTADLGPDRPDALPGAVPREPGTGRLLRRYLAVIAVEDGDGVLAVAQREATGPLPPTLAEVRARESAVGVMYGGVAVLTNIIELADPPAAPEGTAP